MGKLLALGLEMEEVLIHVSEDPPTKIIIASSTVLYTSTSNLWLSSTANLSFD